MRLRPTWRGSRAQAITLFFTTTLAAAVGFLPLFGGPGYESALALGLLLPLPLALASALRACPPRAGGVVSGLSRPRVVFASNLRFAGLVLCVQLLVLILHGIRVGFCDAVEGLALFALGPASGALLAAGWGTAVGLVAGHVRRGRRWVLSLSALPVATVMVSIWRFWSSPMVFAFDPFAGFFAGTLYDTVIDAIPRLITYRAGTLGALFAIAGACAVARRLGTGRIDLRDAHRRPGYLALAAGGAALATGIHAYGPELGHYQTAETIRRALGQSFSSERCDIVHASTIPAERVQLLGQECDAHLRHHEAYFGHELSGRVTVFAFGSPDQKGALMGASNTYIAKPWRREVYVQTDNYPHTVLGHELAHVVAGAFANGPFAVAGPLGGWVPDPGRIEGFAVAAAPPEDSEFSLLEWTKALRELGLLPPLSKIFRLSFLGENSATGYTVAGAVVSWLHDKYGPAPLRAWYAGASVESAFDGKTLGQLETELLADLERVTLSDRLLELARTRFDRPAIFGRRCPHVVDDLLARASVAFERFDLPSATRAYAETLELDPTSFSARLGLAACQQRAGAENEARARYLALAADPLLTRVQKAAVIERLADAALLEGSDGALALYAEAERHAPDEHRARTIAVKRYALASPEGRHAIIDLLIGEPERGADIAQASAKLGQWAEREPGLGLADYLIGKNLYMRGRWRAASESLARALERDLPIPTVRREALRTSIFAACALGDRQRARELLGPYLADPGLSSARKSGMERFAEICRLRDAP